MPQGPACSQGFVLCLVTPKLSEIPTCGCSALRATLGSGFMRFSGPLGMVFLQVQINLVGVSSPMLSY